MERKQDRPHIGYCVATSIRTNPATLLDVSRVSRLVCIHANPTVIGEWLE